MKTRIQKLLVGAVLVFAATLVQAQYNYTNNGDGTCTITGYTGPGGAITIPNSIDGLSVASIGHDAFDGNTNLTSVAIPDSVTTIADTAFFGCTSLASVTIDNSVTAIGTFAFGYCTSLINVMIPASVTSIGPEAFYYCENLTSVMIPGGVTGIGSYAFAYCTGLTNATIPASVAHIGVGVFEFCYSLKAITVDAANANYSSSDGVLFNKSLTTLIQCPGGKAGSYVPGSVTNIGDEAFVGCINLQGIFFKGNAPSVGLLVFYGPGNATAYYLPGTSGWGATFAGRPAVLWNPLMQSSHIGPAGFGFNITGTTNIPIVIEAATTLANATWVPLQSLNLTNGAFYFSDPNRTNYPTRFYRIRSP